MKRRTFGKMLVAAGLAGLGGLWSLAKKAVPRRVVKALRAKKFPGQVYPLDEAEISKPSRWAG